jgi:hypothetical protein
MRRETCTHSGIGRRFKRVTKWYPFQISFAQQPTSIEAASEAKSLNSAHQKFENIF